MWIVAANLSMVRKSPTVHARAIQAHVRHVLIAAKVKVSKGLSKCHAMMPQKWGGGEQSGTSHAKHGL